MKQRNAIRDEFVVPATTAGGGVRGAYNAFRKSLELLNSSKDTNMISNTSQKMSWRQALGLGTILLVGAAAGCDVFHDPTGAIGAEPTVTFVVPEHNSTDVAVNQKVLVTFSEAMARDMVVAPGTITLTGPGGTAVDGSVTYNANSRTATFTPANTLAKDATFTGTVSVAAKNAAGRALARKFTWSFSTGSAADTVAPTVVFTTPSNGESGVAINRKVVATFNEPMDPATIVDDNIVVEGPSGVVTGVVAFASGANSAVFSLTPDVVFEKSAVYTVTIKGGNGVSDLAGNFMAKDYVWTFTTGDSPDTTAPQVSFTTPSNGESGVATNKKVVAVFSELMDPLTIHSGNFGVLRGLTALSGTVSYDVPNKVATFTPVPNLAANDTFSAVVKGGNGVRDVAGNAMLADYDWSFSTGGIGDTTAPRVTFTSPDHGVTDVSVFADVIAIFSEEMNSSTINGANFTVTASVGPVTGGVAYDAANHLATFAPSNPLSTSTTYYASVSDAAADLAGNSMLTEYTWAFTTASIAVTEDTPPRINSTNPQDGATDVPLNQTINATFNEQMKSSSITGASFAVSVVTGPGGTIPGPVSGAVSYDAVNNIVSFVPTNPLTYETTYEAVVSGPTDLAGNALTTGTAPNPWTFQTGDAPIVPLAINLRGLAPFGLASYDGLTSTGVNTINGDVALYPDTTCTDATGVVGDCTNGDGVHVEPDGLTVNGSIYYAGDAFDNGGTANSVVNDLNIAWQEGMNKPVTLPVGFLGGELGLPLPNGKTIYPGVYKEASTLELQQGHLSKLDAQGDPNAVFIFIVGSTITDYGILANPTEIRLVNGAQARNVWFVAQTAANIGIGSTWNGNILAGGTISIKENSTVNGRMLAGAAGAGSLTLSGGATPGTVINVPE